MKNWIALIACTLSLLPYSLRADGALPTPEAVTMQANATPPAVTEFPPDVIPDEDAPKQVGKASVDGANAGRTSKALKYVLAATAVAIGVTALILVSRHNGHRSHHHKH